MCITYTQYYRERRESIGKSDGRSETGGAALNFRIRSKRIPVRRGLSTIKMRLKRQVSRTYNMHVGYIINILAAMDSNKERGTIMGLSADLCVCPIFFMYIIYSSSAIYL